MNGSRSDRAGARSFAPSAMVPTRVWQRMLSGRRLDLIDPSPDDIAIEDIAHGLSRVARWNGQTVGEHVFSVAQHSLLVEAFATAFEPGSGPRERLALLLHDAPEYVIGDLISPFKAAMGEAYKAVELRILAAVHRRFAVPAPSEELKNLIKRADRAAAHVEATCLAGFSANEAADLFGGVESVPPEAAELLTPVAPVVAERLFLERFRSCRWSSSSAAGAPP